MSGNASSRRSSRNRKAVPLSDADAAERQLLAKLLTSCNIGPTDWDLLLVGDGSGSGWSASCGWAATLIDRNNLVARNLNGRRLFFGAAEPGSVNFAESAPYLQAIQWYDVHLGKDLLDVNGTLRCHIITDSQVIAKWGVAATNPHGKLPRKGLAIWASMREYARLGYQFEFHWARRQTSELNWLADLIAGLSRAAISDCLNGKSADDASDIASGMFARRGRLDVIAAAEKALDAIDFRHPDTQDALNVYEIQP